MARVNRVNRLSDRHLLDELSALVRDKRVQDAVLLEHIAEVDRRELFAAEGYSSMFTYCRDRLHLSEGGAYNRVVVARAARRFPLIVDKLRAGEIHHAGLRLLAGKLTEENHRELLDAATHLTKRQIEELLAARFPKPDAPSRIRALPRSKTKSKAGRRASTPVARAARASADTGRAEPPALGDADAARRAGCSPTDSSASASSQAPDGSSSDDGLPLFGAASPAPAPARRPAVVEPLAEKRYRVEFTADAGLVAKLERAKGLLRHRSPHLDEAEVVDRALDALLAQLEKQKFGKVDRPRACKDSDSRYVPADVRRQVYERDGGRCTFVSASGKRCDETAFVEYDHIVPVAHGGRSTVDNLRIRCRAHNQYTARRQLGTRAREASARYRPGRRPPPECADAPTALDTPATSSPGARSDDRTCPGTRSRQPVRPHGESHRPTIAPARALAADRSCQEGRG